MEETEMKVKLFIKKADIENLKNGWNVDVWLGDAWGYVYANETGGIVLDGKHYSVNYYAPLDEDYEIEEEAE